MGRWFRRKDKDWKKGREESPAPPPGEVPASEAVGAGSPRPYEESPPREFQPEPSPESGIPAAFPVEIAPESSAAELETAAEEEAEAEALESRREACSAACGSG